MKVLHLPFGAGIATMAGALRLQGVDAVSCSFNSANYYNYLADIRLNIDEHPPTKRMELRKAFFREAMRTYDLFHFHFGESFFPDKRDLKILAAAGKKMIAEHRGSDVRILSVAKSFNNPYVRVKRSFPESRIRYNLRQLSAYIDHAVVPDPELVPYIQPYYKHVHVVPRAIAPEQYKPQYPSPDAMPLIVHAPSHREIKGTEYVLSAVRRLQDEGYRFQFQLIEKQPREKALLLYQRATIVVDQLLIGAYANLSLEAMAMGKAVVCFIRKDLLDVYPKELPIINANPDTLYDVLKDLLRQPKRWASLGRQGRRYIEQHHSMERAAKSLIDIYNTI